jgi:hypothetical protein
MARPNQPLRKDSIAFRFRFPPATRPNQPGNFLHHFVTNYDFARQRFLTLAEMELLAAQLDIPYNPFA